MPRPFTQTTEQAYAFVNPDEALESDDERYVALDAARGTRNVAEELTRRIQAHESAAIHGAAPECARFLLTGHRGCGKTTELNRLKELLIRAGFAVVYFDAEAEFDLQKQNVDWWNVLLEMVWKIDEQLTTAPYHLSIPDNLRDEAVEWLARVVTKRTERREMEASLTTEFEAGAGLSFFAKAKAAVKALVKTGSTAVKEIEREAERRPAVLRDAVTDMILHVHAELDAKGCHRLVIIVDGLEKVPLRKLEGGLTTQSVLFIHNGNHLKAPPCHLVYTVPLALLNTEYIGSVFPAGALLMPVVRVRHRDGRGDSKALRLFSELITLRVAPTVFAPGVIRTLALASGGHIRDFLSLVRDAATGFGARITPGDAGRAIANMVSFYDRLIEQEFIEALDYVAENGVMPGVPHRGDLVNRLLVLEYRNDEAWTALHPCVRDAPRYVRAPRGEEKASS